MYDYGGGWGYGDDYGGNYYDYYDDFSYGGGYGAGAARRGRAGVPRPPVGECLARNCNSGISVLSGFFFKVL